VFRLAGFDSWPGGAPIHARRDLAPVRMAAVGDWVYGWETRRFISSRRTGLPTFVVDVHSRMAWVVSNRVV